MSDTAVTIVPFKVDILDSEILRLKRKLVDTRAPRLPILPDAGEDYGPSHVWLQRLYTKWQSLPWPTIQAHLNRIPHFLATVPDPGTSSVLTIHYAHLTSSRPDAIPLIMIHGWPGTFYEFDRIAGSLAEPSDPSDPAFHVVMPSLPGFCWSSPPPHRKWTLQDTARVLNQLMLSLGYSHYGAQAGDWGSFVARELGAQYSQHCKCVHLNFCPTPKPDDLKDEDMTDRERAIEIRCQAWLDDHLGYAVMMRTRPQTVGWMLSDNPVGILAWVGEKYNELAAPENQTGDQEDAWDEVILTTCSLYYFTDCIMTSSLLYYENVKHAEFGSFFLRPENRINVPFGYGSFFYDSRPSYKKAVEKTGNLVLYTECDQGGHFAALERPDLLLKDLRTLFSEHFRS